MTPAANFKSDTLAARRLTTWIPALHRVVSVVSPQEFRIASRAAKRLIQINYMHHTMAKLSGAAAACGY